MRKIFPYLLALSCINLNSYAQQLFHKGSTLRVKKIAVTKTALVVDTLPLVPGSFYIEGISYMDKYHIDYPSSLITWKLLPDQDSVIVHYRVFPFKLEVMYRRRDYEDIRFHFFANSTAEKINNSASNPFTDFQTLQTDGSIGRTLILGNNQDVVLNSAMNLQMKGYIGDSIELQALISDNNMPIQPEGNTKDLRDLDRVFIQVRKNNWQINLGDLDLKSEQLRYLKFYKRIQGAGYQINKQLSPQMTQTTSVHAAIAKGKFNRNILTIIEGNQGPYRLKGANNELYFMVLAGTERVFADGILLQRGWDEDYVINYNTAEITFTPHFLVSKDTRVQVEFEYADRNYLNTQIFLTEEISKEKKWKLKLGAFVNQDAKNTSIDQIMDASRRKLLANVGDSIQQAFFQDAFIDTIEEGKILYRKTDTTYLNNLHDSVYVYSSNPYDTLYNLNFTFVGQGRGNYRQLVNAGNGKIYQWIAPAANNVKQGDYEPVVLLVAPRSQQIYTLAATFSPGSRTSFSTDWAFSNNDINLFSSKDKSNDIGLAANLRMKTRSTDFHLSKHLHHLEFDGGFEKISNGFRTIERIRNIEFYRDWSIGTIPVSGEESLADASIRLSGKAKNGLQYSVVSYNRDDGYKGISHRMLQHYNDSIWKLDVTLHWLNFHTTTTQGHFIRPGIELNRLLNKNKQIDFHFQAMAEINEINFGRDSILPTSFAFSRYEASLQTHPDKDIRWGLKYFTRRDWKPDGRQLNVADESHNIAVNFSYTRNPDHLVSFNTGWRRLNVINPLISGQLTDQALVGQFDYTFHWFKNLMNGSFYYELGGGQEPKRDYAFVAVPVGQGNYTWIDYNNNGIEELNEFELAIYQDQKKYIRIQVPGTQFTRVNSVQLNYNVDIDPSAVLNDQQGIKRFFKKISINSSMQINRKQLASAGILFDPGFHSIADSNLVSLSNIMNHVIYFNRLSSHWGLDLTYSKSRNRALYIYGFEDRQLENAGIKGRWNINRSWVWNTSAKSGFQSLNTTGVKFENRNYRITQQRAETGLTFLYKNKFRASISYESSVSKNKMDSMETLFAQTVQSEIRYNLVSNTSIGLKWSLRQMQLNAYQGANQTPVGFVLLDGLQPGQNQLWNIDIIKRMAKNMELNLQYEGRRLSGGNIIHTGRASLRAIF